MTRAQQIRDWLTENPGWHFSGDVSDAFGAKGKERTRVAQMLCKMGDLGMVEKAGGRNCIRYRLIRQARIYTVLEPR